MIRLPPERLQALCDAANALCRQPPTRRYRLQRVPPGKRSNRARNNPVARRWR